MGFMPENPGDYMAPEPELAEEASDSGSEAEDLFLGHFPAPDIQPWQLAVNNQPVQPPITFPEWSSPNSYFSAYNPETGERYWDSSSSPNRTPGEMEADGFEISYHDTQSAAFNAAGPDGVGDQDQFWWSDGVSYKTASTYGLPSEPEGWEHDSELDEFANLDRSSSAEEEPLLANRKPRVPRTNIAQPSDHEEYEFGSDFNSPEGEVADPRGEPPRGWDEQSESSLSEEQPADPGVRTLGGSVEDDLGQTADEVQTGLPPRPDEQPGAPIIRATAEKLLVEQQSLGL